MKSLVGYPFYIRSSYERHRLQNGGYHPPGLASITIICAFHNDKQFLKQQICIAARFNLLYILSCIIKPDFKMAWLLCCGTWNVLYSRTNSNPPFAKWGNRQNLPEFREQWIKVKLRISLLCCALKVFSEQWLSPTGHASMYVCMLERISKQRHQSAFALIQ